MRTLPNTPSPSPPTSEAVTITVEQARALLKIAEERDLCNELVDQLAADLADLERRAASAESDVAGLEARAARLAEDNAKLAQLIDDTEKQVKEIQKDERKRRWRWLLVGLLAGGVAGVALGVAAQ